MSGERGREQDPAKAEMEVQDPDSEREHRHEPGVGGGVIRTVRENTGRNLGWVVGLSGQ